LPGTGCTGWDPVVSAAPTRASGHGQLAGGVRRSNRKATCAALTQAASEPASPRAATPREPAACHARTTPGRRAGRGRAAWRRSPAWNAVLRRHAGMLAATHRRARVLAAILSGPPIASLHKDAEPWTRWRSRRPPTRPSSVASACPVFREAPGARGRERPGCECPRPPEQSATEAIGHLAIHLCVRRVAISSGDPHIEREDTRRSPGMVDVVMRTPAARRDRGAVMGRSRDLSDARQRVPR
jgi:hypothetical protein